MFGERELVSKVFEGNTIIIGVALPRMATMAVITFILLSELGPMHNI